MDIHSLCVGLYSGESKDYEGLNARMDDIGNFLLSKIHLPSCLISMLLPEVNQAETMIKMQQC